jgi:peptidoglycan-associated lipoprotein
MLRLIFKPVNLFPLALLALLISAPASAQSVWPSASPAAKDFRANMKDVLFDYDKHQLPENNATLESNVRYLQSHPDATVRIEGYTDPRGTIIYNMLLAQRRADAAKADLVRAGISPDRIVSTVGWGKLYQTCSQDEDMCWKDNRRAHFRYNW